MASQHFIFISPEILLEGKDLIVKNCLETNMSLSEDAKTALFSSKLPIPFARVISISEQFFSYIRNRLMVEESVRDMLSDYLQYPDRDCVVLCLNLQRFKGFLSDFQNSLRSTQEKVIFSLNEVSGELEKVKDLSKKFQNF